jgi:hypothetical protein
LGSLKLVQAKVLVQRYGVPALSMLIVMVQCLTGSGNLLPRSQVMNVVNSLARQEQAALSNSPAE